jgi:prenyltransferase beta subunit
MPRTHLTRRAALQTATAAGLSALLPAARAAAPGWRGAVLAYLGRLARPGGGFGWADQEEAHLTPTFAVVGCYTRLGEPVPDRANVARFVRDNHPSRLKKLEQEHRVFEFQQAQALTWLGEDASSLRANVRRWKTPLAYLRQYEKHGSPVFHSELSAFTCRELLGLPPSDVPAAFVKYLDARRRPNGSFNNAPASEGGDGHVMNTFWGLRALHFLKRAKEKQAEAVAWLRSCQLANGGFAYCPKPEFAGNDDAAYTWAAVRALALLGAAPAQRDECARYLWSLWNADGGFGDRPGVPSNPVATYSALDALGTLNALADAAPKRPPAAPRAALPAGLKLFSIQIEAHGQGSPAEAVDLARSLRIHLWGAKNARPGWVAAAQARADAAKVPVRFFAANEEYGTWVAVPGLGTYSHTSDIIAPAGADTGPPLAGAGVVSWPEFRRRRLDPLQKAGGRLVWQFGENEELTRVYLDDSIKRGGYAAISTFHFGNPDFTNSSPFLMQYRGRVPFVALQDAHGAEPWWFADMTTGFRTLFLAPEPTWDHWLTALRNNWVAAVRRDAASRGKLWLHAGRDDVAEFVRRYETAWRWWDNPAVQRPLVSVVAVTPADRFEAARPDAGVTIRVRCAWENTGQGMPKKPLAELVRLTVDGVAAEPKLATKKRPRGAGLADHYHHVHLPTPAAGEHTATATVRELATGRESSRTVRFTTG